MKPDMPRPERAARLMFDAHCLYFAFTARHPALEGEFKLRAQMRVELIELHRTLGTTSIHVTHDQVVQ